MNPVDFFETKLNAYYKKYGRKHLPWRKRGVTPYEIWVSEVMLQQTQVDRVIPYFLRFIQRFPTVFDLTRVLWEDFLPYYRGLGYYRRGRNMLETAKIVVSDFGGEFPGDFDELRRLPGVGEYTAAAILSFGFRKRKLALDTNIRRVLGRFFSGAKTADIDTAFFDRGFKVHHRVLNAAMMDFANDVCLGKNPRCNACPLRGKCVYFQQGGRNEFIVKRAREDFPVKNARVHLWLHREHREYYSSHPDRFQIFILPKGVISRSDIKEYFRKKYGLELAVRPPHRKIFIKRQPVLYVNAQILLGKPEFAIFRREEIESIKK